MKTGFLLTFLLCVVNLNAREKEFSGLIKYQTEIIFKDEAGKVIEGATIYSAFTFYYKSGSYFSKMTDSEVDFDYYNAENGEYRIKYKSNDTVYCFDARLEPDNVLLKLKMGNRKEVILDRSCSELILQAHNVSADYDYKMFFYYSEDLYLNPEHYLGIQKGFMEPVYKTIRSVPLGYTIATDIFDMKTVATVILPREDINIPDLFIMYSEGLPQVKK